MAGHFPATTATTSSLMKRSSPQLHFVAANADFAWVKLELFLCTYLDPIVEL